MKNSKHFFSHFGALLGKHFEIIIKSFLDIFKAVAYIYIYIYLQQIHSGISSIVTFFFVFSCEVVMSIRAPGDGRAKHLDAHPHFSNSEKKGTFVASTRSRGVASNPPAPGPRV